MISRIYNILQSVGIEGYYQECTDKSKEYAVYSIYQEQDTDIADNKSQATVYYITINYWYEKGNISLVDRYKDIKNKMKSSGFKSNGIADLTSETHFGKNMDFKIKVWNENLN